MKKLLAGFCLGLIGLLVWGWLQCPCSRIPGTGLSGNLQVGSVDDWRFVNEVELCQIEVSAVIPWSVNLNCMSSESGELYFSCSRCEGKTWSTAALSNPRARLRVNEDVYPIHLSRVSDSDELDIAWQARSKKLIGLGRSFAANPRARPGHWWSFSGQSIKTPNL